MRHAEEVTGNVAVTCRYYGISRQAFYKWLPPLRGRRVWTGLRDRSSGRGTARTRPRTEVVGKIIYLRQNYHFGPPKIAMYLKRYHDVEISASGVWRILKRLDLNRLPASQRYKRHDRGGSATRSSCPATASRSTSSSSNRRIGQRGSRKKYYQYTAIDDCTRLRVLRIYPATTRRPRSSSLDYVLATLPFQVETIQTDNGAEFQSAFHWHLLDHGIGHVYIKPATPRLNGKVERSHRIDAEEFYRLLDGVVIDDTKLFNDKLPEWEDFYNYDRPHGGLGGQTPYERLRQKTQTPVQRPPSVAHPRRLHHESSASKVFSHPALARILFECAPAVARMPPWCPR